MRPHASQSVPQGRRAKIIAVQPSKSDKAAHHAPWCLVLIFAALLPNAWWIARDHSVWPWDQAWYGEVSVDLWFSLTHSLTAWIKTMLGGMYMKPPGIVWIGQWFVPLGGLLGSTERALLASVILTQAVSLYIVFQIGRRVAPGSKAIAALGVCLTASMQSFIGHSHQFFVEPLQALAISWTVLIAIRCQEWPISRTTLHLVGAVLVGVMAKGTTPLYCLLPCLYICAFLIRGRFWGGWSRTEWRNRSTQVLTGFVAVTLPLTAMWYAFNLKAVWQHIREASSGDIALEYGFRASIGRKLIVWLGLLRGSFLSPYLEWALLIGLCAALAAYFRSATKRNIGRGVAPVAVLCALQCGLLLLTFSANDAVDPRYMYPMFPLLSTVLMAGLAPVRSRIVLAAMFAFCAFQFASLHLIALGRGAVPPELSNWVAQPRTDQDWYRDMEEVVRATSTVNDRYNIVGVEEPWLNANSASFFAAKYRLETGVRSFFTSLGYAQKDVGSASERVDGFNCMYYISLDDQYQTRPPNFLNVVSLPMLRRVRNDPRFEQVQVPTTNGVLVFRRR